jgi:hypothetical protein
MMLEGSLNPSIGEIAEPDVIAALLVDNIPGAVWWDRNLDRPILSCAERELGSRLNI